MNSMVIAIDVGNTNTNIGVIDIERLSCIKSYCLPSEHCARQISKYIEKIKTEFNALDGLTIKICSVIKSLQQELVSILSSKPTVTTIAVVQYHKSLPVKINYKNPKTLGTDRIANCLYGLRKYPHQNLIIIDAGTAITIDFLSSSAEFCGGFILPGIRLQLHALSQGTAELPMVNRHYPIRSFPPTSTHAAIENGVCFEIAGGVSFIVKKLIDKYPGTKKILACGGMWKSIGDIVEFNYVYVPELTRIGVGLFEE